MKNHQDFEATPEDDLQSRSDLKNKGVKLNIGADVLFGLTAASAAAMIVMAFFTDFPKKEKRMTSFILSPERGGLQLSIIRTF